MAISCKGALKGFAMKAAPTLTRLMPRDGARRRLTTSRVVAFTDPDFPFRRPKGVEPPAEYAQLRSKCPVSRGSLFDGSPIWLISRMKELKEVLVDDRFSKVRTAEGFPEMSAGGKAAAQSGNAATFVDMDPPEHTKFRGMVEPYLNKQACEAMRPSIQAKVDMLIDEMMNQGNKADLNEAFSMQLPFLVIYEFLGIPQKDWPWLSSNVAVRSSGSSTAKDAATAAEDLVKYMDRLVSEKEKHPGKDLISELVTKQLRPGHLSHDQLVQTAFLLLVAGNATVATQINLGVMSLLAHPDQLAAMKKDPARMVPAAVEEICRYHTGSSYALRRLAKEDVQVDGQMVKKGEGIIALNQSANRDESVFDNPDKFDIQRSPNPQVGFGYGTHVCIAEWLARVDMQCALGTLFRRLPNLKLAVPKSQIQFTPPDRDVGVVSLPITW